MENPIYNDLVTKIIEKEQRDDANAKKIKEGEAAIKLEEENIKKLQILKCKLKGELESSLIEYSKVKIKKDILQQQHLIWTNLLETNQCSLKEEESKLEALQQTICLNRLSFCDNTKEFIEKLDHLEATRGFYKEQNLPPRPNIVIKEEDTDEYNSLFETKTSLEQELEALVNKETKIEEAKRLKLQLQAEPSCGTNFLSLQKSIKDIKEERTNVDTQIKVVKTDITQKELLLLNKKNKKITEHQAYSDQNKVSGNVQPGQIKNYVHQGHSPASSTKIENFRSYTETKEIPSTSKLNLKKFMMSKGFTKNTQSPSLRRELTQQLTSKLDEEMKGILFKNTN